MTRTRLLALMPAMAAAALLASGAPSAHAVPADHWEYHWRDIGDHCADACESWIYKCPCKKYIVELP